MRRVLLFILPILIVVSVAFTLFGFFQNPLTIKIAGGFGMCGVGGLTAATASTTQGQAATAATLAPAVPATTPTQIGV